MMLHLNSTNPIQKFSKLQLEYLLTSINTRVTLGELMICIDFQIIWLEVKVKLALDADCCQLII